MKLSLQDHEIRKAIVAYVDTLGINTTGKKIEVDITKGRKTNTLTAEVDITTADENEKSDPTLFE